MMKHAVIYILVQYLLTNFMVNGSIIEIVYNQAVIPWS